MKPKKTIFVVDPHPLFRLGVKEIIKQEYDYALAGEAGTAIEALEAIRILKPDLVLMDMCLPDLNGIEVIHQLRKKYPQMPILILTTHGRSEYVRKAFEVGANGYMVKQSPVERLKDAIRTAFKGDFFLDPLLSDMIVHAISGKEKTTSTNAVPLHGKLTSREKEVLVLLAEGFSTQQIAENLFISPKTAENHRYNIMRKFGFKNIVELVHWTIKNGLVDLSLH